MKLRLALIAWICACLYWSAVYPQNVIGSGIWGDVKIASGGGGCSAATTFIARTSGLSGTESSAYTAMICGMISDGVGCSAWSGSSGNLDALYIFATNTTATANLNLCSTSYPLTQSGTLTFTADLGYTGDALTGFFDVPFNPSTAGGNWTQNSATYGLYITNSRTAAQDWRNGSDEGGAITWLIPNLTGNVIFYALNSASGGKNLANANAQGSWLMTRTSSSATALYKNETIFDSASDASITMSNDDIYIFALNDGGATFVSGDSYSAVVFGGGLTSLQAASIQHRINAYMTAVGANVY